MQTTGGYTPLIPGYTAYKYAWPYGPNTQKGDGTYPPPQRYYLKMYDPAVIDRYNAFCQKLANYIVPGTDGKTLDQGDYFYMFSSLLSSTLESATQELYDDAFPGHTLIKHEDGVFDMVKKMRANFPNTMVTASLNYTKSFCSRVIPQLGALKIGINTPNMNFSNGLVIGGANPGILTYFQDVDYANSIILNLEMQGDDLCATTGIVARQDADAAAKQATPNWAAVDAAYDFPDYITLNRRCRDDLNAHIVCVQRTYPF